MGGPPLFLETPILRVSDLGVVIIWPDFFHGGPMSYPPGNDHISPTVRRHHLEFYMILAANCRLVGYEFTRFLEGTLLPHNHGAVESGMSPR